MKPNKTIGYSDGLVWLYRLDIFRFSAIFIKGRIAGVEILAVQMLLGATEGIANLTISNKCRFCLVAQGFFALCSIFEKCLK